MAQEPKGRTQTIYAHEFESDIDFRAAVEQKLVDIFPVLEWGRGVTVAPLRVLKPDGTYATEGVAYQEVFMPAVRPTNGDPRADEIPPLPAEITTDDALEVLRAKYANGDITLEQLESVTGRVLEEREPVGVTE